MIQKINNQLIYVLFIYNSFYLSFKFVNIFI